MLPKVRFRVYMGITMLDLQTLEYDDHPEAMFRLPLLTVKICKFKPDQEQAHRHLNPHL